MAYEPDSIIEKADHHRLEFLDIPQDVRLDIYAIYFEDNNEDIKIYLGRNKNQEYMALLPCDQRYFFHYALVEQKRSFQHIGMNKAISLLLVSKAVLSEALPVLYVRKHFRIENVIDLLALPARVKSHIRSLEVGYSVGFGHRGGWKEKSEGTDVGITWAGISEGFESLQHLQLTVPRSGPDDNDTINLLHHLASTGHFYSRKTRVFLDIEVNPLSQSYIDYLQCDAAERMRVLSKEKLKRTYRRSKWQEGKYLDPPAKSRHVLPPLREIRLNDSKRLIDVELFGMEDFGDCCLTKVGEWPGKNGWEVHTYEFEWPDKMLVGAQGEETSEISTLGSRLSATTL